MTIVRVLSALAICLLATLARADEGFPSHAITVIVPFAPGSTTDVIGREVARGMAMRLGQPVVVVNRPGAGGMIGTEAVVKAPADGYTVLFASSGVTSDQSLRPSDHFDVLRDLVPITDTIYGTFGIFVNPSVPATTLPEFLAYARAHPGTINYGSSGVGGAMHLSTEAFRLAAGIDIVHIPYTGGAPALQAALANEVQLLIIDPATTMPQVKSGQMRLLALTRRDRSPLMPDVPTTEEGGLPGFEGKFWYGYFVPAATRKPVVDRLYQAIAASLKDPALQPTLVAQGYEVGGNPPEAFTRQIAAEVAKWQDVVRRARIQQQ